MKNAGVPSSEHAIHFCLALGIQAAYRLQPGAIVFERAMGAGRIDLWIRPWDLAVEVKFRRPIPSGKNLPTTQLLGDFLADFNKVARCSAVNGMVVLVTDAPGIASLQRSQHHLLPLASPGSATTILPRDIEKLPKTAAMHAVHDGPWVSLIARLIWAQTVELWHLAAWEVLRMQDSVMTK